MIGSHVVCVTVVICSGCSKYKVVHILENMYLVPFKPRDQLLSMSRMNVRISGERSSPLLLESPRVTASEPLPDRLDLSFKAHVTIAPLEHL